MTEDQFIAMLFFQLPFTLLFDPKFPIIIAVIVNIIVFMFLFSIAESEFIKDCKKNYKNFDESILPQFVYNRWRGDVK